MYKYKTARGIKKHYNDLMLWALTNGHTRLGVEMLVTRMGSNVKKAAELMKKAENEAKYHLSNTSWGIIRQCKLEALQNRPRLEATAHR